MGNKEIVLNKIGKLETQLNAINDTWNFDKPWSLYERNIAPLLTELNNLHCDLNLIQDEINMGPYDSGDLMSMEEFIKYCRDGSFIDSDGSGYYATETECTDIQINPSWVLKGRIRRDFEYVIWYNK